MCYSKIIQGLIFPAGGKFRKAYENFSDFFAVNSFGVHGGISIRNASWIACR